MLVQGSDGDPDETQLRTARSDTSCRYDLRVDRHWDTSGVFPLSRTQRRFVWSRAYERFSRSCEKIVTTRRQRRLLSKQFHKFIPSILGYGQDGTVAYDQLLPPPGELAAPYGS